MKLDKRLLFWGAGIAFAVMLLRLAGRLQTNNVFIISQNNYYGDQKPINNFDEFPCLKGARPTEKLSAHGKCVRSYAPLNMKTLPGLTRDCTTLKAGRDTPICTYSPGDDLISEYITYRGGTWEKNFVDIMIAAMDKTPDMMLFDVGANIGVYCISAAVYNKKVVCLDANYENVRKVARSLYLGKLTSNATLIWNAVSNDHVTITFHVVKGNVGSSRIADLKRWGFQASAEIAVNSITLNDMQDYDEFKGRPIFMKLDVEAHELHVLLGAEEFFKKVDVRVVQVELAEPDTKFEVIQLFKEYGYLPYLDPLGMHILYMEEAFTTWPTDMYFVRKGLPSLNADGV